MSNEHSIAPPPELVASLRNSAPYGKSVLNAGVTRELWLIHNAYAAGADQELDACCALLLQEGAWPWPEEVARIRAARRPKPPSLKAEALEALASIQAGEVIPRNGVQTNAIRRALEQLP